MHAFDRIGILGRGFLALLGALFFLSVAATVVFGRRHRWSRWSGCFLSMLLAVCIAAASVNNHYAYLPNLGSLWGWRAADQASWASVRRIVEERLHGGSRPIGHGAVVEVSIPGTASHFHARPAAIYLPPAWFERQILALPVVVLLHGTPGSPRDWTRSAGADLTSDRYAEHHRGMAPILVMPDINGSFTSDSECTNGTAGNIETYLTVDVPRWVHVYLHPARGARAWAIGGLSEGGTCGIDMALRHPALFRTFLDFGGEEHITRQGGAVRLFRGTPRQRLEAVNSYDPIKLLDTFRDAGRISGWFEAGSSDRGVSGAVESLYGRAARHGMHVRLTFSIHGHHSFRVWKRAFADALPWLANRLMIGVPQRAPLLAASRRSIHGRPAKAVVTVPT